MKKLQYTLRAFFIVSLSLLILTLILKSSQQQKRNIIRPRAVEGDGIYSNSIKLIIDGQIPPEESDWNGSQCVYWEDTQTFFVIDLGQVSQITGILVQVDNNDDYQIDYSSDGEEYFSLLEINSSYGEIESGMDTMSSILEDPHYVTELEFSPEQARYIKIYATEGNNAYSVSEVQIFGYSVLSPSEPSQEEKGNIIQPKNVEGHGNFNNSADLIIDGQIPPEEGDWDGSQCVYWKDRQTFFVVDLGGVYEITGITVQVDNNDNYTIEYSSDGQEYFSLVEIDSDYGEIDLGMDTMSSISDDPEHVSELEFSSIQARYVMISATGRDNAYSVSEILIFGPAK